jgi:hypothetical protein
MVNTNISPPTMRLHDLLARPDVHRADSNNAPFEEAELEDTLESLIEQGWKWSDLFASLETSKVIWTGSDTYVGRGDLNNIYSVPGHYEPVISFNAADSTSFGGLHVYAPSSLQASTTAESLLHLLAASDISELRITDNDAASPLAISSTSLENFLSCSLNLTSLCFFWVTLGESHCQTLAAVSSQDLHLRICRCVLRDGGSALRTALRDNTGITGLTMENTRMSSTNIMAFADSLRFCPHLETLELTNMRFTFNELRAFTQALQENQGLVSLNLSRNHIPDGSWIALFAALARHPTLELLQLERTRLSRTRRRLSNELRASRTHHVLEMLQQNTVLTKIVLTCYEHDVASLTACDRFLEANLYRPRILAVSNQDNTGALIGRALNAAREHPNVLWMLIQDNVNIVVPKTEVMRRRSTVTPPVTDASSDGEQQTTSV